MLKVQRRITQAYFNLARCQYAPLIQDLAFQIGINKEQIDELKSRGMEELLKCMICYHRGNSFMTFLYGRLKGIFRHMRDKEIRAKRIPTMSLDSMANVAEPYRNIDCNMMAQEYLNYLDDDERGIIIELFFNSRTMRELSDDYGAVPSTICRVKTRAINTIKQRCK